ncbi:aldo/keto reductase (plasmid) [Agrobacterium tumefaciens]|uniref:Aldo/keto reductase n=1 Tax=Agrobacterium tumefaciens TaxID=358 RepID=A0AAJ4N8D5_AGRTU|nr:aldo/keto reductase [Agrobacterium tumefaciens]
MAAGQTGADTPFRLGRDLPINRLGLGTIRLSANGLTGPARDPETGRAVLRRAVELGADLIDTADFYRSSDNSVRALPLVREALHSYPSNLVIATKIGPTFPPEGGYRQAAADELRRLVENDLESLGLSRLDLVYLRAGEPMAPTDETVGERFEVLAKLREEGLIRHLGVSNVTTAQIDEARAIAPVAAVQNYFNVVNRSQGTAVVDYCTANNIAFFPFGPLGMGGRDDLNTEPVKKVAARHNATVYQIAIAWLLARSPVVLPIPGTGSLAHLEENMAARSIVLTLDDLTKLG